MVSQKVNLHPEDGLQGWHVAPREVDARYSDGTRQMTAKQSACMKCCTTVFPNVKV